HREVPTFHRLPELRFAEWLYAVLGSIGAAMFGSFNPLLAYVIALIVTVYHSREVRYHLRHEVLPMDDLIQLFFHYVTRMLRNEVGWFDDDENSTDTLSMSLENDAIFVRAAFSNRLSVFIQDFTAVIVVVIIGLLLQWRLAMLAVATLPILAISTVA
ncbi:ABC transporter B family member 20, partial [Linum perenne]